MRPFKRYFDSYLSGIEPITVQCVFEFTFIIIKKIANFHKKWSKLWRRFVSFFHTQIIYEIGYVTKYLVIKVPEWNKKRVETDSRWVEICTYFKKNLIHCKHTGKIAEYVLTLLGNNA